MMKKAGTFFKGVFSLSKHALRNAVAGTALTMLFMAPAMAQDSARQLRYEYQQNDFFTPSYGLAREAMKDVYRVTTDTNPLIAIAETDLDNDGLPEIIATPVEDYEEAYMFCRRDDAAKTLCPHYVLQVRDKSVRTLAVIWANTVDRDNDVRNGHWNLRAYNRELVGSSSYDTYTYDRGRDQYVHQAPGNR